jgi:hypothetical protein
MRGAGIHCAFFHAHTAGPLSFFIVFAAEHGIGISLEKEKPGPCGPGLKLQMEVSSIY